MMVEIAFIHGNVSQREKTGRDDTAMMAQGLRHMRGTPHGGMQPSA